MLHGLSIRLSFSIALLSIDLYLVNGVLRYVAVAPVRPTMNANDLLCDGHCCAIILIGLGEMTLAMLVWCIMLLIMVLALVLLSIVLVKHVAFMLKLPIAIVGAFWQNMLLVQIVSGCVLLLSPTSLVISEIWDLLALALLFPFELNTVCMLWLLGTTLTLLTCTLYILWNVFGHLLRTMPLRLLRTFVTIAVRNALLVCMNFLISL